LGAKAAAHFGLLVATLDRGQQSRHCGDRCAAHSSRVRIVKAKDGARTIIGAGKKNAPLSKSKSHVGAPRSARNAVHALAREALRSMSDLYFSRHCFEQKPFWASLYRMRPKRPLH
jgi:hypothetical protein